LLLKADHKRALYDELTRDLVLECLRDPVLAARVLMNIELPPHQQIMLREHWVSPFPMDQSGWGVGKTMIAILAQHLKCMLIPFWTVIGLSLTFYQGKIAFACVENWQKHDPFSRSQMLKPSHLQGVHTQPYINGSEIKTLAAGFKVEATSIEGHRANAVLVDEFTSLGLHIRLMPKVESRATKPLMARESEAIKNDPYLRSVLSNQIIYIGHAERKTSHPHREKVVPHLSHWLEKNADCENSYMSFNYRDIPRTEQFRFLWEPIIQVVEKAMREMLPGLFNAEWLGIPCDEGGGLYNATIVNDRRLASCLAMYEYFGEEPLVLGVDVAPGAGPSNFTQVLGKILPNYNSEVIFAKRYIQKEYNLSSDDMAYAIQLTIEKFPGIRLVVIDYGGSGKEVMESLGKRELITRDGNITRFEPLFLMENKTMQAIEHGKYIIVKYSRSDEIIKEVFQRNIQDYGVLASDDALLNKAHNLTLANLANAKMTLPVSAADLILLGDSRLKEKKNERAIDSENRLKVQEVYIEIDEMVEQLTNIKAKTDKAGNLDTTTSGNIKYQGQGEKCSAYAYVYMNLGIKIWRELAEWQEERDKIPIVSPISIIQDNNDYDSIRDRSGAVNS
jgi:hypothetical protein